MQSWQAQSHQSTQLDNPRADSSDEEAGEGGRPERSAAPKRRFGSSAAQVNSLLLSPNALLNKGTVAFECSDCFSTAL